MANDFFKGHPKEDQDEFARLMQLNSPARPMPRLPQMDMPPRPPARSVPPMNVPSQMAAPTSDARAGSTAAAANDPAAGTLVEQMTNGMRRLQLGSEVVTIPIAQTPDFGPCGFGYYVERRDGVLYYPIGDRDPDAGPVGVRVGIDISLRQALSINLAERYNGDWQDFMDKSRPIIRTLLLLGDEEYIAMSTALFQKACKELPGFQENVQLSA